MIFPNAPAYLTPAARVLLSGLVIASRPAHARNGRTLQESVDSAYNAAVYLDAWAAGERAARALQVGDVFRGGMGESAEFYGSNPEAATLTERARLQHSAFRAGYVRALPPYLATCTQGRVLEMRRAVARTRAKDRGGFIVVRQDTPGTWTPVNARMIYPTLAHAIDAARVLPVRKVA